MPAEQRSISARDKHLGAYISKVSGRNMVLWNGACMVHELFSMERMVKLKERHPEALVIAHLECEERVLKHADFIGSTTAMLNFTQTSNANSFIVVTEPGILHQ